MFPTIITCKTAWALSSAMGAMSEKQFWIPATNILNWTEVMTDLAITPGCFEAVPG